MKHMIIAEISTTVEVAAELPRNIKRKALLYVKSVNEIKKKKQIHCTWNAIRKLSITNYMYKSKSSFYYIVMFESNMNKIITIVYSKLLFLNLILDWSIIEITLNIKKK